MEVIRIVEHQAKMSSYQATLDVKKAIQLELLIELTKPKNLYLEWDDLIATPFRYTPPLKVARFRPPFSTKNIFYGALSERTAFYEHAFHFMQQRIHLKVKPEIGFRTIFSVSTNCSKIYHLKEHPDCKKIMDEDDYSFSHQFINDNPEISYLLYPSCRDPEKGENAAIFDINHIEKKPNWEKAVKYFFDYKKKELTWIDYQLHIYGSELNIQ